jgi:hypothetical protein
MQSRAVAVARAACVRASGARVGGSRARASRRGAATRSANADPADDAADVASAILKPRSRGKHLDRPWHLTYLRNQGHGTPAQKAALRDLWSTYGVDVQTYAGPAGDDAGSASDENDPPKRATTTKKSPQKPLPALDFAALFPDALPFVPRGAGDRVRFRGLARGDGQYVVPVKDSSARRCTDQEWARR